ncbi:MAG: polyprenyl synthetase family protein [Pseudohongiella sp.]|nr:polyprenyl synthetase family protein [Pseudohongiella sp.]
MVHAEQHDVTLFLARCRQRCETHMQTSLTGLTAMPDRLVEAMRYSSLLGGKRIRPCLVYASAQALGGQPDAADAAATAVEFIHCYSLIHDDLPAMDNDDLRRGKPTLHRAFDEATAILAGDALQSLAFQLLAENQQIDTDIRLQMLALLARAAGSEGMIAGQSIDLAAVGQQLSLAELENMHMLKTGALIQASVELGAFSAHCRDMSVLNALRDYSRCIGLAFQVHDDVLDVISNTEVLGKPQGSDIARNKPTYVSLLGLDGAQSKAESLIHQAHSALSSIDADTRLLRDIATYITARQH